MKLSRTTWVFLAAGAFIILAAALGLAFINNGQEQDDIKEKLESTNQRLKAAAVPSNDGLLAREKALQDQIAQMTSRVGQAKSLLEADLESIEVAGELYALAEASGVKVVSMTSPGRIERNVKRYSFSTLPLNVRAEGAVPNLVEFASRVTGRYPTGAVESAEITVPRPSEQGGSGGGSAPQSAGAPKEPFVSLNLRIYSYAGE